MHDSGAATLRDLCLSEAERGVRAAELLATGRDYGRARSMDLLAYETVVQAMVLQMIVFGWATFERDQARGRIYVSERALFNHPLKQLVIAIVDPAIRVLADDVVRHAQAGEPSPVQPREAQIELTTEASQPPIPLAALNSMKNEGLYALSTDAGLHTPSEVSEEDYVAIHPRVVRRVKLIRAIIHSAPPTGLVERIRAQSAELAGMGFAFDEILLDKVRRAEQKTGRTVQEIIQGIMGQMDFHDGPVKKDSKRS